MFDHLSIGVADVARAAAFYDALLFALGHVRLAEYERAMCYGPAGWAGGEPPFAVVQTDAVAIPAKFHLAFAAKARDEVDRAYAAALAAGGTDNGPPGIRENYNPHYYAAFVIDPDGHRVELVCHEAHPPARLVAT